jgi:hypothetical protein
VKAMPAKTSRPERTQARPFAERRITAIPGPAGGGGGAFLVPAFSKA